MAYTDRDIVEWRRGALRDKADTERLRVVEALRDLGGRCESFASQIEEAHAGEDPAAVYRLHSWVSDRTTMLRDAITSYLSAVRTRNEFDYIFQEMRKHDEFRALDAERERMERLLRADEEKEQGDE